MKKINWRTPAELVEVGFQRTRVVMLNEAHHGLTRCLRTREVGRQVVPTAHQAGVRYLAMEALTPRFCDYVQRWHKVPAEDDPLSFGYLGQPEMRYFIQTALDLGWELIPYEATFERPAAGSVPIEVLNRRQHEQAKNLTREFQKLPKEARLMVWVDGSQHAKAPQPVENRQWFYPLGYRFQKMRGLEPFVSEQAKTVKVPFHTLLRDQLRTQFAAHLSALGGTAGFLSPEAPPSLQEKRGFDAFILSTANDLE